MRKLAVVGIGPGNYENMTIRADRALRECDVIVGYTVYVDLVKERYADKEFLTTPMLRDADVDMFSTVFIGNAMTTMIGGAMVTPRGYRRKEVPDA